MRILPWLAASIVFLAGACTRSHEWPAADRYKLMSACADVMQKANKGLQLSYCDCVTNEAMKEYGSYQESDAHMNFQKAEELGTRCLSAMDAKDMTLPSSAVFDYGRHWSTDEEHKFLVDCSTSSLKQDPGAKDSVFRYCECAMHRLELQFADPKDTPSDRTALMPMGKACLATAARELPK